MVMRKRKGEEKEEEEVHSAQQKNDSSNVKALTENYIDVEHNTYLQNTMKHIVIRLCFLVGLVGVVVWLSLKRPGVVEFVRQEEVVIRRTHTVKCLSDYNYGKYKGCAPKRCGRAVMDGLVTSKEAESLLRLSKNGLSFGGSNGGASILDLHSGALSMGDTFINIYSLLKKHNIDNVFTQDEVSLYRKVKGRIQQAIATEFGILQENLYLTKPTFFSRMTNVSAKTIHDEYWHVHIDKDTYESFFYTSLLYLTDYGKDFTGGRFIFVDKDANRTVEPRAGRVSFFTSGLENPHYVEKVSSGTRYAITISFTCDKSYAISDPGQQDD